MASAIPLSTEVISIHDLSASASPTEVLFFGYQENSHHSPSGLYATLTTPLNVGGISMTFTASLNDLNDTTLSGYDAVMMYGNARSYGDSTAAPQVPALERYVESGGGLVGLHVASAAFRNNTQFAALLGGRFDRHTAGNFIPIDTLPNHALLKGAASIDSYDETYYLKEINPDVIMLQEREQSGSLLPWTWVRTQGEGRVFYTASGHLPANQSTSPYDTTTKTAYHDLVLRGVQWATKRHFSDVGAVALSESGKLVGGGDYLADDKSLVWSGGLAGPKIFAVAGDSVLVDGADYEFTADSAGGVIPCPGASEAVIFSRSALDVGLVARDGIWKMGTGGSVEVVALEGRALTVSDAALVTDLGEVVGQDFVANGDGDVLYRAQTSVGHVVHSSFGVIATEGQNNGSLPSGVTFGALDTGALTMNRASEFAFHAELAGSAIASTDEALFFRGSGGLMMIAREGDAVPNLSGAAWGSFGQIRMNAGGQLAFSATLTGTVVGEESALFLYDPAMGGTAMLLRENVAVGGGEVDDLFGNDFVLGNDGVVSLFAPLRDGSITVANDRVLLRAGVGSMSVILQEGGSLPTVSLTAVMGETFGQSPLTVSADGIITFLADVVNGGTRKKALFQVQDGVVFAIVTEGEFLSDGPGTAYQISAIQPILSAGPDDGYPSSAGPNADLAVTFETSASQSLVTYLKNLEDLDGDGLENLIEAALGGNAQDPSDRLLHLPSLQVSGGQTYYVFNRPTASGLPSVIVEESVDLVNWSTVAGSAIIWTDQSGVPSGYERVAYLASSAAEKRFLRVAVLAAP